MGEDSVVRPRLFSLVNLKPLSILFALQAELRHMQGVPTRQQPLCASTVEYGLPSGRSISVDRRSIEEALIGRQGVSFGEVCCEVCCEVVRWRSLGRPA